MLLHRHHVQRHIALHVRRRATTWPRRTLSGAAAAVETDERRVDAIRAKLDARDASYRGAARRSPLTDTFQRQHTYLRISLTERCNLRCTYCMPENGVPLTPGERLLSTAEILRLAALFVEQGVTKIRLTGGEPTIRQDLVDVVAGLNELRAKGLRSIAMTSNGIALKSKLATLKANGLDALNISLDTMDPFKFQIITRRKGHDRVLACIDEALALNIPSVKVNCVIMRNVNDAECVDFAEYARDRELAVRFIEYMPFDGNRWRSEKMVPYGELRTRIEKAFGRELVADVDEAHDTTKHFRIPGHRGRIGFITSMTDHFCGTCNRLRITADGNLKVCLFGNAEVSLRDAMREGQTDGELLEVIGKAVGRKKFAHAGLSELATLPNRAMVLIGG